MIPRTILRAWALVLWASCAIALSIDRSEGHIGPRDQRNNLPCFGSPDSDSDSEPEPEPFDVVLEYNVPNEDIYALSVRQRAWLTSRSASRIRVSVGYQQQQPLLFFSFLPCDNLLIVDRYAPQYLSDEEMVAMYQDAARLVGMEIKHLIILLSPREGVGLLHRVGEHGDPNPFTGTTHSRSEIPIGFVLEPGGPNVEDMWRERFGDDAVFTENAGLYSTLWNDGAANFARTIQPEPILAIGLWKPIADHDEHGTVLYMNAIHFLWAKDDEEADENPQHSTLRQPV